MFVIFESVCQLISLINMIIDFVAQLLKQGNAVATLAYVSATESVYAQLIVVCLQLAYIKLYNTFYYCFLTYLFC